MPRAVTVGGVIWACIRRAAASSVPEFMILRARSSYLRKSRSCVGLSQGYGHRGVASLVLNRVA
jgi:hypothetical protein